MNNLTKKDHFHIIDGKLWDPKYKKDFHIFKEDNILNVFVFLPGIVKRSILINIKDDLLILKAKIHKRYYKIFRKKNIELRGHLDYLVEPHSFLVLYQNGIIEISLALITQN